MMDTNGAVVALASSVCFRRSDQALAIAWRWEVSPMYLW